MLPNRSQCGLVHTLSPSRQLLTVAVSTTRLFVGVVDNDDDDDNRGVIEVWHVKGFTLEKKLRGHTRGVSCLQLVGNTKEYMLSAAHDCTVRLWDVEKLDCLCVLRPHLLVGNIYSIACTNDAAYVFLGCQNGAIQAKALDLDHAVFAGAMPADHWSNQTNEHLPQKDDIPSTHTPYLLSSSHVSEARSVFAPNLLSAVPSIRQRHLMAQESKALLAISAVCASSDSVLSPSSPAAATSMLASVDGDHVFPLSHNGYIYCLITTELQLSDTEEPHVEVMLSGSGDGTVKVWRWDAPKTALTLLGKLTIPNSGLRAVLCLLVHDSLLYCGLQGGAIAIFDLATFEYTRQLEGHTDDVNALVACQGHVFSGSADGTVRMLGSNLQCLQVLTSQSKGRSILSLDAVDDLLIVGGDDGNIEIWRTPTTTKPMYMVGEEDALLAALEKFVAIQTVSGDESLREECRRGAKFLHTLMQHLGAEAKIVPTAAGKNPIVVAKFHANYSASATDTEAKTVLFYGHYDVQPAKESEWATPPFTLTGRDGYVYGRGATDNKGPILAALFGVNELWRSGRLPVNVIFLVEGEEESESVGIDAALRASEAWIKAAGTVDCILIANTYWLGDETPCVNYGLRGVVRATVEISGISEDLHSGVHGGVVAEPLVDLVQLLSTLRDPIGRVLIPGFYDGVQPSTTSDLHLYEQLPGHDNVSSLSSMGICSFYYSSTEPAEPLSKAKILSSCWDQPTLSFHNVTVSGPGIDTVIPNRASANISMRLVPNQNVQQIADSLHTHLLNKYRESRTRNHFRIDITRKVGWWVGERDAFYFEAAKEAVRKVWAVEPQLVREGGTIPMTRFLEDWFHAPAVHLPLGQCSDSAHLPNERIRVRNLQRGREVIQQFLFELGARGEKATVKKPIPPTLAAQRAASFRKRTSSLQLLSNKR